MRQAFVLIAATATMCVNAQLRAEETVKQGNQINRNSAVNSQATSGVAAQDLAKAVKHPHALQVLSAQAEASLKGFRKEIRDYTCTMIAQERIDGQLHHPKCCQAKVRHNRDQKGGSVSIYLNFQAPQSVKEREVLWVNGKNDGNMLVRRGGEHLAFMTAWIEPTGAVAMQGNRYSIHEFGIQRLIERMIEFVEDESASGNCKIKALEDVTFDGRTCSRFELLHPVQRDHLPFHLARIYIDQELQLPIRFEAYDWPPKDNDQPVLMERYVYRDLKFNVGLTDQDFDKDNPAYQFR